MALNHNANTSASNREITKKRDYIRDENFARATFV